MEFNPNLYASVPPEPPLYRLEDEPELFQEFDRARSELEGLGVPVQLDALAWTFLIAQETEQLDAIYRSVPWLDHIAVGYHDPELDGVPAGFGIVAYATTFEPLPPHELISDDRARSLDVRVEGQQFPLVVRAGPRTRQAQVVGPTQALTTIWVRSGRVGGSGWLMPHHATSGGSTVWYDDGTTGTVIESFGDCIDAVIADTANPPAGLTQTQCVRGISQGMPVELVDQGGVPRNHTIVDIDVNLGVLRSKRFAVRFTYDWSTSVPGDSGALLWANPCGEPCGMHQGSIEVLDTQGQLQRLAYGLCLYQLETYGQLEVFQ